MKCGSRAAYPQRIIDGVPAPYNSPQIQVGGDETYEPRCDEHFVLPGRPLPGYNDPQQRIWPTSVVTGTSTSRAPGPDGDRRPASSSRDTRE